MVYLFGLGLLFGSKYAEMFSICYYSNWNIECFVDKAYTFMKKGPYDVIKKK